MIALLFALLSMSAQAQMEMPKSADKSACTEMETRDYSMGMCMPVAMDGMSMKMLMVEYHGFFTQTVEEGPRGRNLLSFPNMVMVDLGSTIGAHHYFNVDFMGTVERWTFPASGTPELLQIGEENQNHEKYLDAQHPHSSPIMGLTFSDTITLGDGADHLKIWIAPRGQSTDGPVAFMHRPTGEINPDAPLGHHVGQDVGHITSTVIGSSIQAGPTTFEVSTFNGTEPRPTDVDLPIKSPNSYAARLIEQFSPETYAMISAAFLKSPELDEPDLDHVWRYSGSVYDNVSIGNGWRLHNAFIYGLINFYDHTGALNSFTEEFWFKKERANIWGRLEYLQRSFGELQIPSTAHNDSQWVSAFTVGYTHTIVSWETGELGLGASVTKDVLPGDFQAAYGGNPLTAKVFLQAGGLKMWDL